MRGQSVKMHNFLETHADLLYLLSEYKIQSGESIVIVDMGAGTGFIQKFMIDGKFGRKIINQANCELSFTCGGEINEYLMKELLLLYGKRKTDLSDMEKSKMLAEIERIKEVLSFDETT